MQECALEENACKLLKQQNWSCARSHSPRQRCLLIVFSSPGRPWGAESKCQSHGVLLPSRSPLPEALYMVFSDMYTYTHIHTHTHTHTFTHPYRNTHTQTYI